MNVTIFPDLYSPRGASKDISLVDLLKIITHRVGSSGMTLEAYRSLIDTERTKVKAKAGGFVCGLFEGNVRGNKNLISRSALVLDLDGGFSSLPEVPYQHIAYTTCSSRPESPRYRIIIPFTHDVSGSEYERVMSPIEGIDPCSLRPAQEMFFPVKHDDTSIDLRYRLAGPLLEPELRQEKSVEKVIKSAGEMKGLRGAFNRAVPMEELLGGLLCEVYEPAGARWRYVGSEAIAGVVLNEAGDKLFSHHGTDPAADGRYHDAWDLCRIHLFAGDWKKTNAFCKKYLEVYT